MIIIDTAGRLHTRSNLMAELQKMRNVVARQGVSRSQRVILAMDATTGQNGLMQARTFVKDMRCAGVFLAKLDGSAKGGVVLAIADELDLPVLFVGTGEQPEDIAVFDGVLSRADFDGGGMWRGCFPKRALSKACHSESRRWTRSSSSRAGCGCWRSGAAEGTWARFWRISRPSPLDWSGDTSGFALSMTGCLSSGNTFENTL